MSMGERLYYWRTLKGLSIYKLSAECGVSENHLRNIENGSKQPTVKTLKQITDCLQLTLSEFFNSMDEPAYLTDNEKKLLTLYRSLSPEKADLLLEFYEKLCK